jgi:hypothetical protein
VPFYFAKLSALHAHLSRWVREAWFRRPIHPQLHQIELCDQCLPRAGCWNPLAQRPGTVKCHQVPACTIKYKRANVCISVTQTERHKKATWVPKVGSAFRFSRSELLSSGKPSRNCNWYELVSEYLLKVQACDGREIPKSFQRNKTRWQEKKGNVRGRIHTPVSKRGTQRVTRVDRARCTRAALHIKSACCIRADTVHESSSQSLQPQSRKVQASHIPRTGTRRTECWPGASCCQESDF